MAEQLLVAGIGGSLAANSKSRAALQVALEGAAGAGARTELFDVRELDLPMFSPDRQPVPQVVEAFGERVYTAHGLIWSSPLYHGTLSGSFKNAIDWLDYLGDRDPPYLTDKVVGLISVAGGVQGLQAVNSMEYITRALRAWAVPMVIPIPRAWQVFDEAGNVQAPQVRDQLMALGNEVVRAARQFADAGYSDYTL